jgi:hypothetical protein
MTSTDSEKFTRIYAKQVWGNGTTVSPLSGKGSNPDLAREYVHFVSEIIKKKKIQSVVDLGHGDWSMWRDYKFEDTKYLGFDVVTKIVEQNTKIYGNENRNFFKLSQGEPLPHADLLICKDVLQHLSLNSIFSVLDQLSNFKYVVLCNDVYLNMGFMTRIRREAKIKYRVRKLLQFDLAAFSIGFSRNNSEIESGEWRGMDLESDVFDSHFRGFRLIQKFDYASGGGKGLKKRVLFFEKSLDSSGI